VALDLLSQRKMMGPLAGTSRIKSRPKRSHLSGLESADEIDKKIAPFFPVRFWSAFDDNSGPIRPTEHERGRTTIPSKSFVMSRCWRILEARVGIEPTHKGFADLAGLFCYICRDLYGFVESVICGRHLSRYTSPSKPAPATVSATVRSIGAVECA
jgi:hypothetical protein